MLFNKGGKADKHIVKSKFDSLLKAELERRKRTEYVTFGSLYEDIAEDIGTSVNTIMSLRKKNLPSLEVALAIAKYFEMNVTDIWDIFENEKYIDNRERCKEDNCNRLIVGGGRCAKHNAEEQRRREKERMNANMKTEILFHEIHYRYDKNPKMILQDSDRDHIVLMIGEGYREGELNYRSSETGEEYTGWWRINFTQ